MKKIVLLAFVSVLLSATMVAVFIKPVSSGGTIYIKADGSVEGTTLISSVDNVTYTFTDNIYDEVVVERDNIVVDGAGYTLQGTGNGTGITLSGRSNVTIKNMKIKAFAYGIELYESSNNIISGNNITANNYDGVMLDGSSNNTISGNNITANNYYGIYFEESSNSTIYHNNFVDNTEQVYSLNSTNVWDNGYPSGGNYWSDYIDIDQYSGPYQNETGSDGIWDHPYVIDENNQDNYPIVARGRVYDGIYFPLGDKSFADQVVDFRPGSDTGEIDGSAAIGPPDASKNTGPSVVGNKGDVSLGSGGSITIKFIDNCLIDVDGPDLYVFEIGQIEPFKVEISEDGSNWIDLGTVTGQPTSLDIHDKVAPSDEFHYVRITDAKLITQPYPTAGADIDAVGAIGARARIIHHINLNYRLHQALP